MIKHTLLFFIIAFFVFFDANAQEYKMQVYKDGNIVQSFLVNDIDSINFVKIENSDGDNTTIALAHTTWIVTSSDDAVPGLIFTFKADGTVITNDPEWEEYGGNTYTLDGNRLTIDFHGDDYISGDITIDGDTAIYNYSWYDSKGHWGGEKQYSATLKKLEYDERPPLLEYDE